MDVTLPALSERMSAYALDCPPVPRRIISAYAVSVGVLERDKRQLELDLAELSSATFDPESEFSLDEFARRLNMILDERGVTENYTRWAREHHLNPSGLFAFMRGQCAPQLSTFFLLCRELNVDPAWLMGLPSYNGDT